MKLVETKNGNAWTNVRFFSSFEEADALRKSLKYQDKAGTMQYKIKRCGESGKMFVVKSRVDENALAELQQIEENLLTSKNKKSKK